MQVHWGPLISMNINIDDNKVDKAIWSLSNSGKFSVNSTWKSIRQKRDINLTYNNLWIKDVHFKMSFMLRRAIGNRLSTDNKVARMGIQLSPQCYCCNNTIITTELEDVNHLFCLGDHAKKTWRKFAGS